MSHTHDYKAVVTKKPKSTAEITVEVSAETLTEHRAHALESLGKNAAIDGFRKGHIPEKVLVERIGEMAILSEAAEITISHLYPHIVHDEKLDPIGAPQVTITKLAPGNPLHFTLTVSLVPEVLLPDYKAIAKKANTSKESDEVTEKEIIDAIERIQRQKMAYERIQAKAAKKELARKDATDAGLTLPTPETAAEPEEDYSKLPLPELTDEVAGTLGKFSNVLELKDEVKKHLGSEKERTAKEKQRAKVTDTIIGAATIDLPVILVESELAQMFGEMEGDITRAGLNMDDYLEHIKKTRDDLKKEWTPSAEKRARLQLILNTIAEKEKIVADKEAVEREMKPLLEQFKDADPKRVRIYVESTLKNDAVLTMLESIS